MPNCSIYLPLRSRDFKGEGRLNIFVLAHPLILCSSFKYDLFNFEHRNFSKVYLVIWYIQKWGNQYLLNHRSVRHCPFENRHIRDISNIFDICFVIVCIRTPEFNIACIQSLKTFWLIMCIMHRSTALIFIFI